MIRVLLDILPPLLLPLVAWVLFLSWRQKRRGGALVPEWQLVPWSWLLAAGCALAFLVLVGGVLWSGYATGQYHPTHIDQQGKLVPGGFN